MTKGWTYSFLLFLRAFLLPNLLVFFCPAFFSSCSDELSPLEMETVNTDIRCIFEGFAGSTKASDIGNIHSLDIFVFDADNHMRLDSYERVDDYRLGSYYSATSTSGRKHIVLFANCDAGKLEFSELGTYDDLQALVYEFSDDNPYHPLMSGEADFYAGKDSGCTVRMEALMSEITISRISGISDTDEVRVHLKNQSVRAPILSTGSDHSYAIEDKGEDYAFRPGISLYCYQNPSSGGLGSPHTELIITCRKENTSKEYSIIINDGKGIERNARYEYTVNVSRQIVR